jgi:hypothetical protein
MLGTARSSSEKRQIGRAKSRGNDPKVAGLVYVTAFAPDKGESAASIIKSAPPGAPAPPILPPQDGYLFLDKAKFSAAFAADVSPDLASFMADSQVPWGVEALGGAITQPAWRTKPSWYLITTEDKMIPPDAQRAMSKRAGSTIVEVKSSYSVFLSHLDARVSGWQRFLRQLLERAGLDNGRHKFSLSIDAPGTVFESPSETNLPQRVLLHIGSSFANALSHMNDDSIFFEAHFIHQRFHQVDSSTMNGSLVLGSRRVRYLFNVKPSPLVLYRD